MTIKNFAVSILAVAAFGSFAMAQQQPPNQPNQPPRDGMRRGDGRGMGEQRQQQQHRRMGRAGVMRMRAPGHRGPGGRIDFNRLNLTDAQKQRIQSLLENNRRTGETNRAQFEEMAKLMGLKREGLLTTEQGTRLTALQAQMKTNADRMQSDLLAILTPEQRTLVDQMKNERGGGGNRMRGMRRMDGDNRGGERRRMMPMRRQMPGAPNRSDRPTTPGQQVPPPPPTSQNN